MRLSLFIVTKSCFVLINRDFHVAAHCLQSASDEETRLVISSSVISFDFPAADITSKLAEKLYVNESGNNAITIEIEDSIGIKKSKDKKKKKRKEKK